MNRRRVTSACGLILAGLAMFAAPAATVPRAQGIAAAAAPPINASTDPLLQGFRWRSIGPTGQGGRIDDLTVDEKNPYTYYIGFAVSGVWRTTNNGTTFAPIFDTYGVSSIGDLALAPSDPNVLYVGTGEANNRQTSSFGNGIWKSVNAAAANPADVRFVNVGLPDSQSIARIVVHPRDPNIVWVAVAGHLYGPNTDRGVFMTTDGGKTWTKTLFVNADTGATEIVIDPGNPMNLWAAMYEHRRTAWGYAGGGPGSGLYQSTDGGKTWKKVTGGGLPHGTVGRIGLDICKSQPNVIYAQIEVAPDKEPAQSPEAAGPAAGRAGGRSAGAGAGGGNAGAPGGARAGLPPDPQFDGIWKSTDKGRSWTFVSNENQRPMYFSQIRIDPNDPNVVYTGGVTAQKSIDGGKTFASIASHMGHVDNHAIWIDPANSRHVMYGNDGGLDVSWDGGATWESPRLWAVGLAYHVSADMRHPYWVCAGLQDNGSWCGPSQTRTGGIHMWNWIRVGDGDGFQNQIDPDDPTLFYTESQNAGIARYNLSTGQVTSIKPNPAVQTGRRGRGGAPAPAGGAAPAEGPAQPPQAFGGGRSNVLTIPPPDTISQFNWNSPIRLSPHNASTIYVGGRQLFVSRDRGDTWTMTASLGKDIDVGERTILGQRYSLPICSRETRGTPCILSKHDGYLTNEFGTLTELAESPLLPGVLWSGTDDGNVQISKDGGHTWAEVGRNIPGVNHEYYVSGLEASWFDAATAYVALDGHRDDDLKPYIFKTTDYGETWKSISGNLPESGNVNSIRQDPVNHNLLFAPTEFGFYVTLDEGQTWKPLMTGLPAGRVDEVLVHPREHDLILATHSRSVWIMDDITPLEQTAASSSQDATLLRPRNAVLWKTDRTNVTDAPGDRYWEADPAPRGTAIAYLLKAAATEARIVITDTATSQPVLSCAADANFGLRAGLNRFQWPLVTDQQVAAANRGGGAGRGGQAPAAGQTNLPACGTIGLTPGRGVFVGGRGGGAPIHPGVYRVTLTVNGKDAGSQTFDVLEDAWLTEK
jgi:photosystem II stability/assembly factor-like uncharacterized protein